MHFFVVCFLRILRPSRSTHTDTLFLYIPARLALRRPARRPRLAPLVPADNRVVAVEEVPVALVLAFPLGLIGVQLALPVGLVDHASLSHLIVSRSEEHTSALQSLMRISYAVFCLKKKTNITTTV